MNDDNQSTPGAQLKSLMKEACIKSTRLDATKRLAMFSGRTRDWTYTFNLYNGWLHITTYVCEVPELDGLRAKLMDVAMAPIRRCR